jgi:hypothetical protein
MESGFSFMAQALSVRNEDLTRFILVKERQVEERRDRQWMASVSFRTLL